MSGFRIEWEYYLQAFRQHQGLTKGANSESRKLLRQSAGIALGEKRNLPRAYGLLSFTIQTAWLCNWLQQEHAEKLLSDTVEDLTAVSDSDKRLSDMLAELQSLQKNKSRQLDEAVRLVDIAYAEIAKAVDAEDYESHWSLATANLYGKRFAEALGGYEKALRLADEQKAPQVCQSSISVDYADALFFAGNGKPDCTDAQYIAAIEKAIDITKRAISDNPTDPKRHRWNWTLGWAYYELGCYTDLKANCQRSLDALQKLRNPHDLIRKNLIASHSALGNSAAAAPLVKEFLANNPGYTLAVENRWPYNSNKQRERWQRDLRQGGLPG